MLGNGTVNQTSLVAADTIESEWQAHHVCISHALLRDVGLNLMPPCLECPQAPIVCRFRRLVQTVEAASEQPFAFFGEPQLVANSLKTDALVVDVTSPAPTDDPYIDVAF